MRKTMLALCAAALLTGTALAQTPTTPHITYIQAGALLDKPGSRPRGPATIIVRDGKVAEVRDGLVAPEAGAELVDLRDRFVLPGLIDMHVHFYSDGDPLKERLESPGRDYEDELILAARHARITLEAGFTTVRDLGGEPRGIASLRDAINTGDLPGPTIVPAGRMISISGGHGDANGLNRDYYEAVHQHQTNVCDGADECRRAVRAQIRDGAETIKFAATGGVLSNVAGGLGRQMTPDEMKAIVETAHSFGRKATAHAHAKEGIETALEAGVDSIEHGSFLDDNTIKLFKAKGAYLVPTMIAPVTALRNARAGALPAASISKAESAAAAAAKSHALAIRSGVKIAFGTDTGVSKHGTNAQEFALMVQAGMTADAAIRAATVDAADLLGRSDRLGTIEAGKDADIIAVAGSPLDDVRQLENVDFVMRHGVVHKLGGKRQAFPAE
ncbi:Imidazolonepropionase [Sphingomonas laterariae]|uniref:Imidazolonepropionase n=1 Tax=Edaphosphingomonas laterariae TaxID=861865 RepID=A0A239FX92_9SPHN|nr:amidohydrolase family protein [Sphingomonas laterariae]SNS61509.1 Imidazolonepropionase [Sphingomonas laterariae]